jgi:Tol biopolymer transport system component
LGRPGHILSIRSDAVIAQPFDYARGIFVGESFQVVAPVDAAPARNVAAVSVSQNGLMLYRPMSPNASETAWFDRSGRKLSVLSEGKNAISATLSPSGDRAGLNIVNPGSSPDIWIYDFRRDIASPVANSPNPEFGPAWSPDGGSIAYSGVSSAGNAIWIRDASGAAPEKLVWEQRDQPRVLGWTPDARNLILLARPDSGEGAANGEVQLLPVEGSAKLVRLTNFPATVVVLDAALSPDGRWLSYTSNESGRAEVYVREFRGSAGLGARWKVSNDGGSSVRWRPDSKELFYLTGQGILNAVPISGGSELNAGAPVTLFQTGLSIGGNSFRPYDVTKDGSRFLMTVPLESAVRTPMILLTNWLHR